MRYQGSMGAVALGGRSGGGAVGGGAPAPATIRSSPDWKGQWTRVRSPNWRRAGRPEGPAHPGVSEGLSKPTRADLAAGGVGDVPSTFCIPQGMPMMMNIYDAMDIVVTPEITYLLISHVNIRTRRICTDGREEPEDAEENYPGYSVGKWIDTKGDGHYDELDVETRAFKGRAPRRAGSRWITAIKASSRSGSSSTRPIPTPSMTRSPCSTMPLTQPGRSSRRPAASRTFRPKWHPGGSSADNSWVRIGNEAYYLSADGNLMPIKKNQAPPDLKYFERTQK